MQIFISLRSAFAVVLCVLFVSANALADNATRKSINIPAEDLSTALEQLSRQAGTDLIYRPEQVAGIRTGGAIGDFSAREAVTRLLEGTRLTVTQDATGALMIAAPLTIAPQAADSKPASSKADANKEAGKNSSQEFPVVHVDQTNAGTQVTHGLEESKLTPVTLEEIVVTGTHIRNASPVSPVITLTHDQLVNEGYTRLDQAIEQLPQNFRGAVTQDSNGITGAGALALNNYSFASGVNLRGIGPGATLVLLNGERLPQTAVGQSVDISLIPLSIIDRVEILTDGASATYGSDAIAGVVNIITRRDYSGVETEARSTGIADGKTANYGGSTLGGLNWKGGNAVASVDYEKDSPLNASARSFTAALPEPTSLFPRQETLSGYGSLRQSLGERLAFSSDLILSRRDFDASDVVFRETTSGRAEEIDALAQLDYAISTDWTTTLVGQLPKEIDRLSQSYIGFNESQEYSYSTPSIEASLHGSLFRMPGGPVQSALGASYRQERFGQDAGAATLGGQSLFSQRIDSTRHATSAYVELLVPLVTEQNEVPLARTLRLDVAGRYDDYSDFGSTSNPKVAIEWQVLNDLSLHGSFAKSFRAPTLYEMSPAGSFGYVWPATDPTSPSGKTTALVLDGTNPDLLPERARSFSAGLSFIPHNLRGFKADLSLYDINYQQRIDRLAADGFAFGSVLEDASLLGSLVNLDPSLAQIEQALSFPGRQIVNRTGAPYTVATIKAIANIGYVNVGSSRVRGLDATVSYAWETRLGRFHAEETGSYFDEYKDQTTPASPPFTVVNRVYEPSRFRGKANLTWSLNAWGAIARLNYVGAYRNPEDLSCSASGCPISSWTTIDIGMSYTALPEVESAVLRGVRIALQGSNVLNREPPFVRDPNHIGFNYDPNNASPLGRSVAVTLSKRW